MDSAADLLKGTPNAEEPAEGAPNMHTTERSTRMKVSYRETLTKLLEFLSKKENGVMVLSTSARDVVTSRNVLVANDGLDLYFFTWARSRKCAQIQLNPRISLCKDRVEIEGKASLLGPMFAPELASALGLFKRKEPEAIAQWKCKPSMVIYHITPLFASVDGCIEDDEVLIEYIDFEKRTAYREKWADR